MEGPEVWSTTNWGTVGMWHRVQAPHVEENR